MLGTVRRGHVLARTLRTCIPRSTVSVASVQQPLKVSQLSSRIAALPVRQFHVYPRFQAPANAAAAVAQEPAGEASEELITEFADLSRHGIIHDNVVRAITSDMGLTTMTDVQAQTLNLSLAGNDVLAQAKTGTGKTIAFLLPVIQNIIKNDESLLRRAAIRSSNPSDIRALIISPTRELAEQISVETIKIVKNTGLVVQTAVGGTRKAEGLRRIQQQGCHILVGTPGRLIDILSDPRSGVDAPNLSALVLDEADRLLDDGFAPAIDEIKDRLPDRKVVDRQTLMFSATMPREVMRMVERTMKPDFSYINTIPKDEVPTHLKVPQRLVFLKGLQNQMPALVELAKQRIELHKQDPENVTPFKAIVYYNSTNEVSLAREAFERLRSDPSEKFSTHPFPDLRVIEMQSKLTQSQRTRNSSDFRRAKNAILFSSDVTARGMDFPNVTHIIQFGTPRDRETYIHRLGRTARANKSGEGWIFLTELDYFKLRSDLKNLPLKENTSLAAASADLTNPSALDPSVAATLAQTQRAYSETEDHLKASTYVSTFSFNGGFRDKRTLVEMLNELSMHGWGMSEPPAVDPRTADKLGMTRIKGVKIGSPPRRPESFDRSDRFSRSSSRTFGSNDRGRDGGFSRSFGSGDRERSGGFSRSFGSGDRDRGGGFSRGGRSSNSFDRRSDGRRSEGRRPDDRRSSRRSDDPFGLNTKSSSFF
ncbi:hypothetical protein AJ80_00001 [Polytolypa hystricis UAMH7299]|uniref:ATP-dependent RNA helicase n=1 Tax=Polytolypa hystricis (strain UAMH7299) TaxID=1447883 RepID=A0A2B7Z4Z6_POLH7|nr:hypothetical protein AJ80_00001 [Polytolypa hystricis UAMH7299]